MGSHSYNSETVRGHKSLYNEIRAMRMFYFISGIAVLTVMGIMVLAYFFPQPLHDASTSETDLSTPSSTLHPPATAAGPSRFTPGQWVPPGFKGPTGPPHIVGPNANPPNY